MKRCLPFLLTALMGPVSLLPLAAAEDEPGPIAKRIPGAKNRNIVFIMVDDHRPDVLGFTGHPFVKTPNLDYLAAKGVFFTNAFANACVSSPSRASFLSGLEPRTHTITGGGSRDQTSPRYVTFLQVLEEAGYETASIGRSDNSLRMTNDYTVVFNNVNVRGYPAVSVTSSNTVTNTITISGQNIERRDRVPRKDYVTDEITDIGLEWLKTRDKSRPFFLGLWHLALHTDYTPAERHKGAYAAAPWTPPPSMADTQENYDGKPAWLKDVRTQAAGVDRRDYKVEQAYRDYCETVLAMDESIGRILDLLRQQKILDQTLIIYTADHGTSFGEHGLAERRGAYEENMRIPLIMHCPEKISAGMVVTQLVTSVDVAPSILEAAGIRVRPGKLDGASVFPILRHEWHAWRNYMVFQHTYESSRTAPFAQLLAVRGERFKYILSNHTRTGTFEELYDLQNDPAEIHNLAKDQAFKQTFDELKLIADPIAAELKLNPQASSQP